MPSDLTYCGNMLSDPVRAREDGSVIKEFLESTGAYASFVARFFRKLFSRPFDGSELVKQMDEVGSKSFVLIAIMGLVLGLLIPMQARGTLTALGASSLLPDLLVIAMFKEIGPVFTAIMLAGRIGSGFSAELGSMRVSEQISAMEVAAVRPFQYLVVTRILACILMFPIMTLIANSFALVGGFLESSLVAGSNFWPFIKTAFASIRLSDLFVDTGKTVVFGFLVGSISCFLGYTVKGGTREVGQVAMWAVVISSIMVILADFAIVQTALLIIGDVSVR